MSVGIDPGDEFRRIAGTCDNDDCAIILTIEVGPESRFEHLPATGEWDDPFADCPVCDGSIDWLEFDLRASWERAR